MIIIFTPEIISFDDLTNPSVSRLLEFSFLENVKIFNIPELSINESIDESQFNCICCG